MTKETSSPTGEMLIAQLDMAWSLLAYHLSDLSDEECYWQPTSVGLAVHETPQGWQVDWPEHEGYEIGPPNIAWVLWHIHFWWSMALDHCFADGTLTREALPWPGSAQAAKEIIADDHRRWRWHLSTLSEGDYHDHRYTRWPFSAKAFSQLAGWLNSELMKNAAEIGYCRFLYATKG